MQQPPGRAQYLCVVDMWSSFVCEAKGWPGEMRRAANIFVQSYKTTAFHSNWDYLQWEMVHTVEAVQWEEEVGHHWTPLGRGARGGQSIGMAARDLAEGRGRRMSTAEDQVPCHSVGCY